MGIFSFLSCCYAFRLCFLNKTGHVQFTSQNNLCLKASGIIFRATCQPSPYNGTLIWLVHLNCSNWKVSPVICYVAWTRSSLLHPDNIALVGTNHSAYQGRSVAHPCSGTHPMLDSFQKPGQFWAWDQTCIQSWLYSQGPLILSVSLPKHKEFSSLGEVYWYFTKFWGRLERKEEEYHEVLDAVIILRNVMDVFIQLRLFAGYIIGYMIYLLFDALFKMNYFKCFTLQN